MDQDQQPTDPTQPQQQEPQLQAIPDSKPPQQLFFTTNTTEWTEKEGQQLCQGLKAL
jgi:CO dehydrogenase/acetyl-CoA synthase gamma subunit (corrinoid Fe-S protein)